MKRKQDSGNLAAHTPKDIMITRSVIPSLPHEERRSRHQTMSKNKNDVFNTMHSTRRSKERVARKLFLDGPATGRSLSALQRGASQANKTCAFHLEVAPPRPHAAHVRKCTCFCQSHMQGTANVQAM